MKTHDFTATMQFGTVSAIDAAAHSLRVKIPVLDDMVTDWLPMATPAAGGNRFTASPMWANWLSACWMRGVRPVALSARLQCLR